MQNENEINKMFQKEETIKNLWLYRLGFSLIAFKLLVISSYLSFDLVPPVPITAQTLVVLMIGYVMGPRWGGGVIVSYLILGGLGLPVFAGGKAGWAVFQSASAGYLVGFLAGAVAVGMLRRRFPITFFSALAITLFGTGIILLFGGSWLSYLKGMAIALEFGIIPFIPGGLLKSLLGALISPFLYSKLKMLQFD